MATESPVRLVGSSGAGNWSMSKDATAYTSSSNNMAAQDLGLLLKGHRFPGDQKDAVPNRSGSAPPNMEGSLAAIGNLFGQHKSSESEEKLRADPAYLKYYCSNVNLNPRLPPPLISQDSRHLGHHIGGFGDNWKMTSFDDYNKGSLPLSRPALSTHKEEPEDDRSPRLASSDWTERNRSGQYTPPLEGRLKTLVDLIQEDFPRTPSPVYNNQSRNSNHGATEAAADPDASIKPVHDSSITSPKLPELNTTTMGVHAGTPTPGVHSIGLRQNGDLSAVPVPSSSSSDRTASPHPGLKEEPGSDDNSLDSSVLESEMMGLKLTDDVHRNQHARQHPQQNNLHPRGSISQAQGAQSQMIPAGILPPHHALDHFSHAQSNLSSVEVQPVLQSTGIAPLYAAAPAYMASGAPYYPNLQPSNLFAPQYCLGGYPLNTSLMPSLITGYPHSAVPMPFDSPVSPNFNSRAARVSTGGNFGPGVDLQHLYGQLGLTVQPSFPEPLYMHYFQHPSVDAFAASGQYDPMVSRGSPIGSQVDSYDPQQGLSPVTYSPDRRPQILRTGGFSTPSGGKGGTVSPNYYGSPPNMGVLMQYPTSPLASPVLPGSPVTGTSLPARRNENNRYPHSSGRTVGVYSGWQGQRGQEKVEDPKSCSFLEELKSSKARRFELSDIAGRIVDFSADQHGSRFIQQKLENCSVEDKASVFEEVLPHASRLMTDVFGNYVIQKFFEHGSPEQRKQLATKLAGHILSLSLQMYGCRVIQKALEVIELDQKTELVLELDGHVMRCVRDQNGNHVIQKCIECVPTEKIGFIISAFRGQVATLSTHPYGCRVIQRVLEHCTDELQSHCIVDEILQSACVLAQDQYGNYVTQREDGDTGMPFILKRKVEEFQGVYEHVLERGKPHERSQIISKLAGQIVQMSQHKFASNVIEKCLEHGGTAERELLIEEIVGQTEGNDNLLIMMKDQFANYVVQKFLETSTDKQREILVNRIRAHLQALKKYTYGKHIAARVEQFCCEEEVHVSES